VSDPDRATDPPGSGDPSLAAALRLLRAVEPKRDHVRGGSTEGGVVVVGYQDFLCPYCRRLREVLTHVRKVLGDRFVYVFRHSPNERAHPGAELVARASEAAAKQGKFWEMHDRLFDHDPRITERDLFELAQSIELDMTRFVRDLADVETVARVGEDLEDGRRNGVTSTPTLFIDGHRYDGAWDFHSLLEAIEPPVAARVKRSARAFASLPASGGLVLLIAALVALACANTPIAPAYERLMDWSIGIGPVGRMLTMTVREWFSEGLFAIFFLLVGLEIRREMTGGMLADRRAAILPIIAAFGGVVTPALIYLAFNRGSTARGWSIPTATDVAFTLGILAVMGAAVPTGLRVFVAALAVFDDLISMGTLAIFYPRAFEPVFLLGVLGAVAALYVLNRARVYVRWPYAVVAIALWVLLHAGGVHAALAGVVLAIFLPTRPPPSAASFLAQAATALAALEHAEDEAKRDGTSGGVEHLPIWDWASRNLTAASERLLSPADRIERAVAPWSAYVILPLFALSAAGVRLSTDLSSPDAGHVFFGVFLGLVVGKPLGILIASGLALGSKLAVAPADVTLRQFVGAACLCGVSDTVALLMVDRAFANAADASVAKIAVLAGSAAAALIGSVVLLSTRQRTPRSNAA
jgi:NhaA family Na+:H+ antiporter